MYRWNYLSSERDIAGKLRYLVDLAFLRCRENERYIGDISEEQNAINDDNRLHYFSHSTVSMGQGNNFFEEKFQGIANTLDIQL